MNDRHFRAWADAIDNRPSYGSRTAGRILFMGTVEKRCRSAPWEISARRRQYQLRLMRARMAMEEIVGR